MAFDLNRIHQKENEDMKTETIKSIQRVYDETLKTISLKTLQEHHWSDKDLMNILDEIETNNYSIESLQHKLKYLELLLKGEENGIAI